MAGKLIRAVDRARSACVACVVLIFVLQAVAAQAKGLELDHAVLDGPGLRAPLKVSREEFGIVRSGSSPTAIALQRFFENKSESPPPGSLGPSFELSYHLNVGPFPDATRRVVHLTLFPYAESGAAMFIPAGQGPIDDIDTIEPGWEAFPRPLVRNLQRSGMPSEPAARNAADGLPPWVFAALVGLPAATVLLFTSRKRSVIPLGARRIPRAQH
ncbi:MAG: hypothetical protein M3454_04790 [Actinomycetota bacterium]|nr:hypothetical protein [Actinomycetota bacterium]